MYDIWHMLYDIQCGIRYTDNFLYKYSHFAAAVPQPLWHGDIRPCLTLHHNGLHIISCMRLIETHFEAHQDCTRNIGGHLVITELTESSTGPWGKERYGRLRVEHTHPVPTSISLCFIACERQGVLKSVWEACVRRAGAWLERLGRTCASDRMEGHPQNNKFWKNIISYTEIWTKNWSTPIHGRTTPAMSIFGSSEGSRKWRLALALDNRPDAQLYLRMRSTDEVCVPPLNWLALMSRRRCRGKNELWWRNLDVHVYSLLRCSVNIKGRGDRQRAA